MKKTPFFRYNESFFICNFDTIYKTIYNKPPFSR